MTPSMLRARFLSSEMSDVQMLFSLAELTDEFGLQVVEMPSSRCTRGKVKVTGYASGV